LSSNGGKDLVFVYRASPVQLCHVFEGLVVLSTAGSLEHYVEAGGRDRVDLARELCTLSERRVGGEINFAVTLNNSALDAGTRIDAR
jgi:hypothetical protein